MFFNSCQMVNMLQNEISDSTHDFQHLASKNYQTQSGLSCVESHAEEIKTYCDGNEISEKSCNEEENIYIFLVLLFISIKLVVEV